ncbi:natural killer cells antigen CD94-like [Pteronotus mesoamericanus]|uniref:natural killer cells antigen CD94-like n=1 Tax=Pteronotus mesoamericanus TaxID=1884717 RepID=UPI0023EAADBD|nr:natural killer cells antigen CD94-like [Pteronotus parnellii mesoamericanus]
MRAVQVKMCAKRVYDVSRDLCEQKLPIHQEGLRVLNYTKFGDSLVEAHPGDNSSLLPTAAREIRRAFSGCRRKTSAGAEFQWTKMNKEDDVLGKSHETWFWKLEQLPNEGHPVNVGNVGIIPPKFSVAMCQTTPWRLISVILGVTALVLMGTLGILLTYSNNQTPPSPAPTTEPQERSVCCSCQEKWIGYKCNCYFISNDVKTWAKSKEFCVSQNSSLLQLHNGDELQRFMSISENFYWVGLSYSKEHNGWLWENGSALIKNQLSFAKPPDTGNCILYSPTKSVLDESCTNKNYYICKQQLL